MDDIYEIIEQCNPNKKCNILIVSDDMIARMLTNKKLNPIATELFIRGRKLKISLEALKVLKPEENQQDLNSVEGTFLKRWELIKLKIK